MNNCVKVWSQVPYGGIWYFVHPATGKTIKGRNRSVLIEEAKAHAISNNLPIGLDFEGLIEKWVCESMPDECVHCIDGRPIRPPQVGMMDVLNGTKSMVAHAFQGFKVVDLEVAKDRAKRCSKCPYNVTFKTPCGGMCGELAAFVVKHLVDAQPTGFDLKQRACAVCHCLLEYAVHVPLEAQCRGVTDQMRSDFAQVDHCWKHCT